MKLLRLDMTNLTATFEELDPNLLTIGGRGLTARILAKEVEPSTDPLGPGNKLILAAGPLAGTGAPSCGRISVGAKSPLTKGIKEANAGGPAAQKLDRLGIRAMIVEGARPAGEMKVVTITAEGVLFSDAAELTGVGNYELAAKLRALHGGKIAVCMTGLAGERSHLSAAVTFTDADGNSARHAARGGLGAVMGSKGLKAIAIDDSGTSPVSLADKGAFKTTLIEWSKMIKASTGLASRSKYGTPGEIEAYRGLGTMPSKNYSSEQTEGFEALAGPSFQPTNLARGGSMHGCMPGCIVKCSVVYHGPDGEHLTSSLEYETLGLLGTNLGISDPDAVARMDRLCDELGVDTIEVGSAMGVAASAGKLTFGHADSFIGALEEIREGTEFGKLLADGVVATAKSLGVERIPAFKGQAIPAHDPRVAKPGGVTYHTSPMGADHTAGLSYANCMEAEGAAQRSLGAQLFSAIIDSLGYCLLAVPGGAGATADFLAGLMNARYAVAVSRDDILVAARETLRAELGFNTASGFHTDNEPDPEFVRTEPVAPYDPVFDVEGEELERLWEELDSARLW